MCIHGDKSQPERDHVLHGILPNLGFRILIKFLRAGRGSLHNNFSCIDCR
jgi:hypothetical protein